MAEDGANLSLLEGRRVLQVKKDLLFWRETNKPNGGKAGVLRAGVRSRVT